MADADPEPRLVNRLAESQSPYVRAHRGNPVAWQMWTPETLALAKKLDRLIFLSIGYSACHWCHVMERESFSHPAVAAVLNASFVPIKLDREERPDIDRIYMNYVSATTGSGGWPLNVFLTPDLRPLFGGTYWPGPGATLAHKDHVTFEAILRKMERVWSLDRARCQSEVETVLAQLENWAHEGRVSKGGGGGDADDDDEAEELDLELLDDAWEHFSARFDSVYGGFGRAPKFPTPAKMDFLLNLSVYPQAVRDVVGDEAVTEAKDMVVQTLHAMSNGGIKDQIGHGFSRYSVTRDWSLPHFEKMLYDNAQLLHTYTTAYVITRNPLLLTTALDLAAYLTSAPILSPQGSFLSSEDADSPSRPGDTETREGAYYVWTAKELRALLGDRDAAIAINYWGVREGGNVPHELDAHDELLGQNVLAAATDVEALAIEFGLGSTHEAEAVLKRAREALWRHREQDRVRPLLDDKVVVAWNGLAVHALAGLAKVLEGLGGVENERIKRDVLQAAEGAVAFVKKEMTDGQTWTMKRVYREGLGDAPAFSDDYAFFIAGLIELYEATWDDGYLELADALQKTQIRLFWDSGHGGFYSTAENQPDVLLRLKDGMDNAEPSANGVSARNLFRLGAMLDDDKYTEQAKATLHAFEAEIMQHPFLFPGLLDAIVMERFGVRSYVVRGDGERVREQLKAFRREAGVGRTVVRLGAAAKDDWIRGRNGLLKSLDGEADGVQVCEGGVCKEILESSADDLVERMKGVSM